MRKIIDAVKKLFQKEYIPEFPEFPEYTFHPSLTGWVDLPEPVVTSKPHPPVLHSIHLSETDTTAHRADCICERCMI